MAALKILVIEDEEAIQELIRYNLSKEGYTVVVANNGEEGIRLAKQEAPGLILLDLMLPGIDGLEVCKSLKQEIQTAHIPVVMLTAKGEESDIVIGLEMGADDYVTKPFSPRVLLARIKRIIRRPAGNADPQETVQYGEIVLMPGPHRVLVQGKSIELTASEFNLLHIFMNRPGWVFTRSRIVDLLRGDNYPVTERSVDVVIVGLRRKLGNCGDCIKTVRGVGYRLGE
ncbi:MAG: response regulator [Pirellulaceae bacterium]|nr:response regulator [Pirellulaceae bacterium]